MIVYYKKNLRLFLLPLAFIIILNKSNAQLKAKSIWKDIPENEINRSVERKFKPTAFRTLELDLPAMKNKLLQAPKETPNIQSGSSTIIQIPLPDGSLSSFRITEVEVMHPDLAKQFPGIRTFSGQGIDDLTATGRFDFTQFGFHAMIMSHRGTIFIEPYTLENDAEYICYDKSNSLSREPFVCDVDFPESGEIINNTVNSANKNSGANLRTYRLALACTGEYAAFYGGTVSGAMSGIVTSINRVTGVYQQEVQFKGFANGSCLSFLFSNAEI